MALRLKKTLLTEKISTESKWLGMASLLVLIALFGLDDQLMHANGQMVFAEGKYWRAFTTTFVHADYKHLAHNSVFFTGLAILLNNYFGNLVFPVLSLLVGGIINLIVLKFYPAHIYLVGISGVVYFMAAMWLTLYLLIEKTIRLRSRIIIACGLFLIFLAPEVVIKEEVSYLAHGVGFALGIPSALLFYYLNRNEIIGYERWEEQRPDPLWVKEWEEQNQLVNDEEVTLVRVEDSTKQHPV